jgi:hypothetical protein
MRRFAVMSAVCLTVAAGCKKEAAAPVAAPAAGAEAAGSGAGATPAPPGAPRRERAGIETGAAGAEVEVPKGERPAAAELVPTSEFAAPPEPANPDAELLAAAWEEVLPAWHAALEAGDAAAFKATLNPEFIGDSVPGGDGPPGREAWPAARKPPVSGPSTVAIGAVEARLEAGPAPVVYFQFHERAAVGEACTETRRELMLRRDGTAAEGEPPAPWLIRAESAMDSRPCEDVSAVDFAAAHHALGKALGTRDVERARERLAPAVWLRDDGALSVSYDAAAVLAAGHWLAAALAATPGDADTTRAVGRMGMVSGSDMRFVYEAGPKGPVLVGVERGRVGRLTRAAAAPAPEAAPVPEAAPEVPPAPVPAPEPAP